MTKWGHHPFLLPEHKPQRSCTDLYFLRLSETQTKTGHRFHTPNNLYGRNNLHLMNKILAHPLSCFLSHVNVPPRCTHPHRQVCVISHGIHHETNGSSPFRGSSISIGLGVTPGLPVHWTIPPQNPVAGVSIEGYSVILYISENNFYFFDKTKKEQFFLGDHTSSYQLSIGYFSMANTIECNHFKLVIDSVNNPVFTDP